MTINEVITEIITEVGGDPSDSTLTAKMFGFFKAGYRRIPALIRDRNFLAEGTITVSSGSDKGDLTSLPGFIREREVWFQGDNLIHIPIYRPPSTQYWHKVITPNASGKPFYFRIYGKTIQLDKKADKDLLVGFDYFKEVSAIELTDTWDADEQIMEAAKDFCKMVYFGSYEEDEAKASRFERQGKDIISRLEEEFEVEELGGYVDEKY